MLKDRSTSQSRDSNEKPYLDADGITCFVFDYFDDARQFCETKVQSFPSLRCEVYDSDGLAHPPLLVVVHRDQRQSEESGAVWSRRRKFITLALFLIAPPLIWIDVRQQSTLPTFLAFNCILTGLRLLYWDFGLKR